MDIGTYSDSAAYARDLLITAAPHAYAADGLAEADAVCIAATPDGIRDLQQWAADQPSLPDAFRKQLRAAAWATSETAALTQAISTATAPTRTRCATSSCPAAPPAEDTPDNVHSLQKR